MTQEEKEVIEAAVRVLHRDPATWLAMDHPEIPSHLLARLVERARELVKDEADLHRQLVNQWADRYNLAHDDAVTNFMWGICHTTLADVRDKLNQFEHALGVQASAIMTLAHRADQLEGKTATQVIQEEYNFSPSALNIGNHTSIGLKGGDVL